MKRTRQGEFKGKGFERPMDWFGGSYLKSHPKSRRPLDSKMPLHIVLRTNRNILRLPKNFARVNRMVESVAQKNGVRIYEYANVGNHLHLLVKIPRVHLWAKFIRELTGRIAQVAQDLKGQQKGEKFWSSRPFTRVVKGWKRAYRIAKDYLLLNQMEGEGLLVRGSTARVIDLASARHLTQRESEILHSG
jgi:REP element-mobilizing transposase RayT